LINKTNQFNVTTRRYTQAEVEGVASGSAYITLYGRLLDKFGDNGLISVVIGECRGAELHVDLWIMSCRVLKRGMEQAMMDQLVAASVQRGIRAIYGYYYPSAKNGMVRELFGQLGFSQTATGENGDTVWRYDIAPEYVLQNQFIEVNV